MAEAELVRLLYVATTRASDHLVLSLFRGPNAISSPAARIEACLEGTNGLCHPLVVGDTRVVEDGENSPQDGEELAVWGSLEHEEAWLARRRALVDRLGAAPRVGMAGVVRAADNAHLPLNDAYIDPEDLEQQVRALVRRLSRSSSTPTGDENPLIVERSRAIIESQAFKAAVANPTCRWNVPLLAMVDATLLDLAADLLYETVDGLTLVAFRPAGNAVVEIARSPVESVTDRERAGLIALALLEATGLVATGVEVIEASDGSTTRLTDEQLSRMSAFFRHGGSEYDHPGVWPLRPGGWGGVRDGPGRGAIHQGSGQMLQCMPVPAAEGVRDCITGAGGLHLTADW